MDFFINYNSQHKKLIEKLKIVLYKKDQNIFDYIDFNDDDVLYNPFIFSILNEKKIEQWKDLLIFCFGSKGCTKEIEVSLDEKNISYIPNIGQIIINSDVTIKKIRLCLDKNNILTALKSNYEIN